MYVAPFTVQARCSGLSASTGSPHSRGRPDCRGPECRRRPYASSRGATGSTAPSIARRRHRSQPDSSSWCLIERRPREANGATLPGPPVASALLPGRARAGGVNCCGRVIPGTRSAGAGERPAGRAAAPDGQFGVGRSGVDGNATSPVPDADVTSAFVAATRSRPPRQAPTVDDGRLDGGPVAAFDRDCCDAGSRAAIDERQRVPCGVARAAAIKLDLPAGTLSGAADCAAVLAVGVGRQPANAGAALDPRLTMTATAAAVPWQQARRSLEAS